MRGLKQRVYNVHVYRKESHAYLHAFVLAHDASQLQITFDLLSDLLEAVNDGHGGDGVDTTQDVQSHVHQTLTNNDRPLVHTHTRLTGTKRAVLEGTLTCLRPILPY